MKQMTLDRSFRMSRRIAGAATGGARLLACMAVCMGALLALAGQAQAAVVAAWNMNGIDPLQQTVYAATAGSGTVDFGGLGASASVLQGTTLGAMKGELAGDALAAIGTLANGTSMRLDFGSADVAAAGYTDLTLTFATRRSSTGPSMNRVEYWSGLGWLTALEFSSNATTWQLTTVKFTASQLLADGYGSVRFVLDGATSTSGSIRFDNIAITGTPAPAPGAIALLGLAGCVGRRRRD